MQLRKQSQVELMTRVSDETEIFGRRNWIMPQATAHCYRQTGSSLSAYLDWTKKLRLCFGFSDGLGHVSGQSPRQDCGL